MWGDGDSSRGFVFPPVFHDPKTYEAEKQHTNGHVAAKQHFRGRGRGSRGNYQNSNTYQRGNNNLVNKQFYCDACDRACDSAAALDEHLAQHETCGWNGCTFQAHYKVVELHVKMQHETGLADKIMRLNTPEEIEKWKQDRRRNYPTAENVTRRQAEQAEKSERGEVIPCKEFGKMQRNGNKRFERGGANMGRGWQRGNNGSGHRGTGRGGRQQWKRKRPDNNNVAAQTSFAATEADDGFGWSEEIGVKRLAGIRGAMDDASELDRFQGENGDPITDSDGETTGPAEQVSAAGPRIQVPKALENLLAAYSSDSEPEETSAKLVNPIPDKQGPRPETIQAKPRAENRPRPTKQPHNQPKKRPSILEGILAKDIQDERNKIFQCVRYIVQSEFFGIH